MSHDIVPLPMRLFCFLFLFLVSYGEKTAVSDDYKYEDYNYIR